MLRVTKEADYGIMLLAYMAGRPAGVIHSAKEAARWTGLPLPMVSKILRALAREGMLDSHRGAAGGYSLDKSPGDLSIADVIRALEGPISLVQCGSEPGVCEQEEGCSTRVNWSRISSEVETALERVTLAEMLPAPPQSTLSSATLLPIEESQTETTETA